MSARSRPTRSLRVRLTVGLTLLVLAVVAVVVASTALLLRSSLTSSLDSQLAATSARVVAAVQADPSGDVTVEELQRGQAVGTLLLLLPEDGGTRDDGDGRRDGGGGRDGGVGDGASSSVVRADGTSVSQPLSRGELAALESLGAGAGPRTVELGRGFDYRVLAVSTSGATVVTGLPLNPLQDVITQLVAVEVVVGLVAAAVGAAATALVVSRGLRPLRSVSAAALQIARLPLAGRSDGMPPPISTAGAPTEVAQVGDAVNRMVEHVQRALQERDAEEERRRRFVADASHELRTPLAVVQAHAENALRSPEALPDGARHAVERIRAASERMAGLVDDLLLLARLDAGSELAHDDVPLSRLVLEAVADAQAADGERTWSAVLPEEPVDVVGDADRLHQVVAELLRNAGRHTPPGTAVTTTLTVAAGGPGASGADGPFAEVVVHDDGPGIPQELRPAVFDRFTRASGAREGVGTGLGLAIARGIAVAHGGDLRLLEPDVGTAVLLRLPAQETVPGHG